MERCAQGTVCTDARHQPTPELNDETIGHRRSGLLSTILILEYSSATLPRVSVPLHKRGTEDKGVSVAVQLQLTGVVLVGTMEEVDRPSISPALDYIYTYTHSCNIYYLTYPLSLTPLFLRPFAGWLGSSLWYTSFTSHAVIEHALSVCVNSALWWTRPGETSSYV